MDSIMLCLCMQFPVVGRHGGEFFDDAGQDVQRSVDVFVGIVSAERKANRALRGCVGNVHGAQRRRRLVRRRVTRRSGRDTDAELIEVQQDVLSFDVLERDVRRVWQTIRGMAVQPRVSDLFEDSVFQTVAKIANA